MCLSWHGGRSVRKWKRSHIVVGFPVYEGANCSDHGGVAAAWRDMWATCRRRAARTINGAVSRWRGRADRRAAECRARRSAAERPTHSPGRRRHNASSPEDKFGANENWRRWAPAINVRRGKWKSRARKNIINFEEDSGVRWSGDSLYCSTKTNISTWRLTRIKYRKFYLGTYLNNPSFR